MSNMFSEFGLSNQMVQTIARMGFVKPTPIQSLSIGPLLKGHDVIGVAQTGTGKTAAFGIPMVDSLRAAGRKGPYAIILVPTRELAIQVAGEIKKLGAALQVKSLAVYGGQSINRQISELKAGVSVVVGTPGRILDHIQRKTLLLSRISMVVLDEADEMLDMGFIHDIERILTATPSSRQTVLFSATMPDQILRLSARYMRRPEHISVAPRHRVVKNTEQYYYEVYRDQDKMKTLAYILATERPSRTLLFCHTKRDVDMVDAALRREGHKVGAIHGDFTQQKRDAVMRRFRNGKISILVATDVAARGLDIDGVSHVVNHSVPQNTERYIHRIGRTGRMGKPGVAITFVTPDKHRQFKTIEQGARTSIHRKKLPVSPAMERLWNDDSRVKMFGFASQKKSAFSSAHPLR